MADIIEFEYTAGNTVSLPTDSLDIIYHRHRMKFDISADGDIMVNDQNISQRTFSCSCVLDASDAKKLNDHYVSDISYGDTYPRITTLYWKGETTESNILCAIASLDMTSRVDGQWGVNITLKERTT